MTEQEEFEFRLRLERENDSALKPEKKGGVIRSIAGGARDLATGAVRGAGSIGATLVAPYDIAKDAIQGKGLSLQSNRERRAGMDEFMRDQLGADTDSLLYQGGKLGGEIAGTAGAGGLIVGGTKAAPLVGRLAPRLSVPGLEGTALATRAPALLDAIRTSGMTAGGLTGKASILPRMAGGALTGGASAALISPDDAVSGAVIGAAAPPVIMGAAKLGGAAIQGVKSAMRPQEAKMAERIAATVGIPNGQLRSLLNKQGPQLIQGYQETVPQILQDPAISQLQRTLKTAGNDALGSAERTQQQQFMQTLNRVAPTNLSVQDAAARAGGAIESYALPAREEAGKKVSASFNAVDPFGESGIMLPIQAMEEAAAKYLGPGTFDTGQRARKAIATAREIGMQEIPAVKAIPLASQNKGQTLEQAVRSAGGLRGNSGELRDLGIRQSGTTGLINNKNGNSADILAEEMKQRGFIQDADPATLYDALRNGAGRNSFSDDFADASFSSRMEQSMGDLPGAQSVLKAVPFQTMQNLRSSIGTSISKAASKQENEEVAALTQMKSKIDGYLKNLADGNAGPGEFFDRDMAAQYKEALGLHADKMRKFETGPQVGMFRQGGDGQRAIQGAEIPSRFYSGKRSQVEDMQAFKRLTEGKQAGSLANELQSYATTEAANTATAAGNLSSKYGDWLASRSGANRELFDQSQNASLKAIADAIGTASSAENLGRVTGSDTAQKLASLQGLGLLDSKVVDVLANRIPGVGSFTGPILQGMRNTAKGKQSDTLARLLADPQALNQALTPVAASGPGELATMLKRAAPAAYRIAPIIPALTD